MGTTRPGLALLAALVLLGLDPAAAPAQQRVDQTEIPPEVRAQGRRLQGEARAHVEAQRWALAAQTYHQLYELSQQHGVPQAPIALWNVGLALMRIPGREAEARDAFERFLDDSTTLTDDAQVRDWRSTALEHIAELNARLGADEGRSSDGNGSQSAGNANPEPASRTASSATISPVGPIVLGVSVLTLGVGGVFGGVALTQESALRTRCGGTACLDIPEHRSAYDEMRTFGTVTDVLLVIGGLAAITGTILTFTLTQGGSTETSVAAALRPGGAQLAIGGSF